MTSSIFCPVCQRKNKTETMRCAYCGSALSMEMSGIGVHTTLNIDPSVDGLQTTTRCNEYLEKIAVGDICIIFEKKQTPIVLHNISETVLGRFFDESEISSLDLDPYGGGAFGVSRRHARIIRIENNFVFEDMNSTNGSWLNGRRIPSGTTYPLMSGDQIWLGQFKMQVCFHQEEQDPSTILFLRDTTTPSKKLSTTSLLADFGPYLQRISDLQTVVAGCLQIESPELAIEKIDATGSDSYIVVNIDNKPEAIYLIRKWITPWRQEQQTGENAITDPIAVNQAMVQLSSKIIADIALDLSNEEHFKIVEQTLPIVTDLATGSIELSFEAF